MSGKGLGVTTVRGAFKEKYALTGKTLGKGSYAEVQEGLLKSSGEKVAVKIIKKHRMSKRDEKKLFEEVKILRQLRHKNIVRVLDAYEEDKFYYVVMEFISGGELFAKIADDDHKFTEEKSKEILLTLLMALKHCKDNGVIHRDLKPENILLDGDEDEFTLKVVDFNLSKQIEKTEINFSILETQCGTPNYVAPEVLSGNAYDYKCDIWSLGVIGFLLLSGGYLPFFPDEDDEDERASLLEKVKLGTWNFLPEDAWAKVSTDGKDLIKRMLVANPEARGTYEQLMNHKWFKNVKDIANKSIDLSMLINFNQKRKMLSAEKVHSAVKIFEEMMNSDEDDLPLTPLPGRGILKSSAVSGLHPFDTSFSIMDV